MNVLSSLGLARFTRCTGGAWACPAATECVSVCLHSLSNLAQTVVGTLAPGTRKDKKVALTSVRVLTSVSVRVGRLSVCTELFARPPHWWDEEFCVTQTCGARPKRNKSWSGSVASG